MEMLYDTVRDKWCFVRLILLLTFMLAALPAMAAETGDAEKTKGETHEMGQVVVTATKAKEEIGANVGLTPAMESIDLDQYEAIALPQNIGDYLQNLVLFDYRDNTNLVPGSDSFYMRSFA
jgi:hypothetical protein